MNDQHCPACGSERDSAAPRCDSCGLTFLGEEQPAGWREREPEHLSFVGFGGAPEIQALESESAPPRESATEHPVAAATPLTSAPPRRRWRRRLSTVALVVLVVVVVVRFLPDPLTLPSEQQDVLADMRAAVAEWRASAPPAHSFATDLASFQAREPAAWAEAQRQHVPPAEEPESVHALFEWFVSRLCDQSPEWGLALGVHPHPTGIDPCDASSDARQLVLLEDLSRRLRAWPADALTSTHDAIDRDAFLQFVESVAAGSPDVDASALVTIEVWVTPFLYLESAECCPAEERAAVALTRLDAIATGLPDLVARLRDPEADDLTYTVQLLGAARDVFASYADEWEVGPALESDLATHGTKLAYAIDATLMALAQFRGRLPQPEHDAAMMAEHLRWSIGPDADIGTEFDLAVESLERALLEQEAYTRLLDDDAVVYDSQTPLGYSAAMERAREEVERWVPFSPGEDPGIRLREVPPVMRGVWAGGFYLGSAPLAPLARGAFLVDEVEQPRTDWDRTSHRVYERRIGMHEVYPGHHVHHVLSARTCRLRRTLSDPACVEGWATYAEDLADSAPVDGDAAEAWQRIGRDVDQALGAVSELAVFGLGVSRDRVRRWLAAASTHGEADYVARTRHVGQHVPYEIGVRQIRDLVERARSEAGSDFDLRTFHRRLLENGPLPVRFHAEELLGISD